MEDVVPWVPKTFDNINDITSSRVVNYSFDYGGEQAGFDSFAFAKEARSADPSKTDAAGGRETAPVRVSGSVECGVAAQPPIMDMLRAGCTKSGWLMRWPDHLRQTVARIRRCELVVGGARAHRPAQVRLLEREQAGAHLPSAVRRRRLHVSQNGSVTLAITPIRPARRRRTGTTWPARSRDRSATSGNTASIVSRIRADGNDLRALPRVLGVERHVLDEPDLVARLARPARELDHLVVVRAADHDAVDLDRREPGLLRGLAVRRGPCRARRAASSPRTGGACSESQQTVARSTPASASGSASRSSRTPFVVMEMSSSGRPRGTSGRASAGRRARSARRR